LGKERAYLRRLESLAARSLAAAGFPALRIRGGVEPAFAEKRELDLGSRLAEAEWAVRVLADDPTVERVGVVGALFGGTVAALTSERLGLDLMALWQPVLRGRQYLKYSFRRQAVAALVAEPVGNASNGKKPGKPASPIEDLNERGVATVRGFELGRKAYEEIGEVDLLKDISTFKGRALLVSVATTTSPDPGMQKLAEHLADLGAEPDLNVIVDSLPIAFGECYFRDAGLVRVDLRLELDEKLAAMMAAWASELDDRATVALDRA